MEVMEVMEVAIRNVCSVERGILFGDYFAVNAGLPVSPAHLVPDEDWDMESGESPAPLPKEKSHPKKAAQTPNSMKLPIISSWSLVSTLQLSLIWNHRGAWGKSWLELGWKTTEVRSNLTLPRLATIYRSNRSRSLGNEMGNDLRGFSLYPNLT
ncbi:hypothetical protein DAPPUDRAFT_112991 [Daphnia pulex]|uniref:Uncharacterized protein n=1 Tax=Daphnia pulex TaxID=6669 RepID=E9HDQ5_DAPPU|nr:hypothetical protein DAPPUDRAFT_112991 [Daphnia pulex]|eukprot:EFX70132.1 hypothetical protein DAPPUDRAFT_112991 [Daphnia pulex]